MQWRHFQATFLTVLRSRLKSSLKSLWSYVNSKRNILDIPGSVFLNNVEAEEGDDIIKLYAVRFENSFIPSDPIVPPLLDHPAIVNYIRITGD